jgi:hypothetical protein
MGAVAVDVAEAIKDELAAYDFGAPLTVQRSYADWETDLLDENDGRCVDVVPLDFDINTDTDQMLEHLIAVDIGLRRRFSPGLQDVNTGRIDIAEIDSLMLLLQKIAEWFLPSTSATGRQLTTYPSAAWWPDQPLIIHVLKQHMRDNRQFAGFFTVRYSVPREALS